MNGFEAKSSITCLENISNIDISVNDNKKTKVNDLSVIPVGCRIKHITLGEGTVISNEKGRLKVSFKKHGLKVLDANFVVKANQIEKI